MQVPGERVSKFRLNRQLPMKRATATTEGVAYLRVAEGCDYRFLHYSASEKPARAPLNR